MIKTIRHIVIWCGQYKSRLYLGLLCSFFSRIFALIPIVTSAYLLGLVVDDYKGVYVLAYKWVYISAAIVALSILLRFLFDYLRARYQESISYELAARDRLEIGKILKKVSLGYFQKYETGRILNDITSGLNVLENMGMRMVDGAIGGYISVLIVIINLSLLDIRYGVIALAGILCSQCFIMVISHLSKKNAVTWLEANGKLTGATVEFSRGLQVVKSFGVDGMTTKHLKKACAHSKAINCKIEKGFTPFNSLHYISLRAASVGIGIFAVWQFVEGSIQYHALFMVLFLSFYVFAGIEQISGSAHILGIIENALHQLESLKNEDELDCQGKEIDISSHDIQFKHVDFSYDNKKVLKNISITIPEQSTTAIVGPSGSGKTTICNLIARFYRIQKGELFIGGQNINHFSQDSLMKNISMVFQNVYLFQDTVLNNIRFSNPYASYEEVTAVAKRARCHDFIMKLSDGYDTIIGEGGSSLSGGEKQRISIARAMLKDAPIIILDEATASIDPENEMYIQDGLMELTRNKTVIIIAHRIATIEYADKIIVMDKGQVSEEGNHQTLKHHNGIYQKFLKVRTAAESWQIG